MVGGSVAGTAVAWAVAAGSASAATEDALGWPPVTTPEAVAEPVVSAMTVTPELFAETLIPGRFDLGHADALTDRARRTDLMEPVLGGTPLLMDTAGLLPLPDASVRLSDFDTDTGHDSSPGPVAVSEQRSPWQDPEVVAPALQSSPRLQEHPVVSSSRTASRTDETPPGTGDAPEHAPAPVPATAPVTPAGWFVGSSGPLLPCDRAESFAVPVNQTCTVVRHDGAGRPVATGSQPGNAPD